jgi:hypothetical protein
VSTSRSKEENHQARAAGRIKRPIKPERLRLSQRTASAALSLLTTTALLAPGDSHAKEQCAFNGRWEACKAYRTQRNGAITCRKVIWLSDGKVVTYQEFSCSEANEYTSTSQCKVKIIEDNGRVTYGTAYHSGGRGIRIQSERGNITDLPP